MFSDKMHFTSLHFTSLMYILMLLMNPTKWGTFVDSKFLAHLYPLKAHLETPQPTPTSTPHLFFHFLFLLSSFSYPLSIPFTTLYPFFSFYPIFFHFYFLSIIFFLLFSVSDNISFFPLAIAQLSVIRDGTTLLILLFMSPTLPHNSLVLNFHGYIENIGGYFDKNIVKVKIIRNSWKYLETLKKMIK